MGDTNSKLLADIAGQSVATKRRLGQIQSFMNRKLTMAQVLAATQVANQVALGTKYAKMGTTLSALSKGLKGVMTAEGEFSRQAARHSGAAWDNVMLELFAESSTSHSLTGIADLTKTKFAKSGKIQGALAKAGQVVNDDAAFFRAVGHMQSDTLLRIIGANMGGAIFDDLIERKVRLRAGEFSKGSARKMLKVDKALKEAGISTTKTQYTKNDREKFMLFFSDEANLSNAPTMIPNIYKHPMAKIAFKFRPFAFLSGRFVNQHLVKPIREDGNFKPALTHLSLGAASGVAVDGLRRTVAGDDKDYTQTELYLRGLALAGGFGLVGDTLDALSDPNSRKTVSALGGPFVGDVTTVMQGVRKSAEQGSVRPIAGALVRSAGGSFPFKRELVKEIEGVSRAKSRRKQYKTGN